MLHHYCWLALCCKIRWSGMDQRYWHCYFHAFNEMSWTDIGVSYFPHAYESTQWCMNTSSKLRSSNVVQSNLIFIIDRMLECPLIKVPPLSTYQASSPESVVFLSWDFCAFGHVNKFFGQMLFQSCYSSTGCIANNGGAPIDVCCHIGLILLFWCHFSINTNKRSHIHN